MSQTDTEARSMRYAQTIQRNSAIMRMVGRGYKTRVIAEKMGVPVHVVQRIARAHVAMQTNRGAKP